jgi:hypothetical protein
MIVKFLGVIIFLWRFKSYEGGFEESLFSCEDLEVMKEVLKSHYFLVKI